MSSQLKRILNYLAFTLILAGFLGFIGFGIASFGASKWLPADFEWPATVVHGVEFIDDRHYVPHPSGRIQVYDAAWNFLHAFHVPSDGGVFVISRGIGPTLIVHTARGNLVLEYSASGEMLSQRKYDYLYPHDETIDILPTPWYQWPVSHPFGFWAIAVLGVMIHLRVDTTQR